MPSYLEHISWIGLVEHLVHQVYSFDITTVVCESKYRQNIYSPEFPKEFDAEECLPVTKHQ